MNNKVRIYDLARKLNKTNKELIAVLQQLDIPVKSHSSSIDEETAKIVENILTEEKKVEKVEEVFIELRQLIQVVYEPFHDVEIAEERIVLYALRQEVFCP